MIENGSIVYLTRKGKLRLIKKSNKFIQWLIRKLWNKYYNIPFGVTSIVGIIQKGDIVVYDYDK